jgi:hypothetical protein
MKAMFVDNSVVSIQRQRLVLVALALAVALLVLLLSPLQLPSLLTVSSSLVYL